MSSDRPARKRCPEPWCDRDLVIRPDGRWPFHYTSPGIGQQCSRSMQPLAGNTPVPAPVDSSEGSTTPEE